MVRKKNLVAVVRGGNYLEQLKNLALDTAEQIEKYKEIPEIDVKLRKELRETLKEINRVGGMEDMEDEIGDILTARKTDGKSNAVR